MKNPYHSYSLYLFSQLFLPRLEPRCDSYTVQNKNTHTSHENIIIDFYLPRLDPKCDS